MKYGGSARPKSLKVTRALDRSSGVRFLYEQQALLSKLGIMKDPGKASRDNDEY